MLDLQRSGSLTLYTVETVREHILRWATTNKLVMVNFSNLGWDADGRNLKFSLSRRLWIQFIKLIRKDM